MNKYYEELKTNVIDNIFYNLINNDKELLLKYYNRLLDFILYVFKFPNETFIIQLRQNNYQDAKGLINLLLPFINDDSYSYIKNLNDIYVSKKDETLDINEEAPTYNCSNIQYGRVIRNDKLEEIQFEESHLTHNFYLLLNTIKNIYNKLYVNWINIIPFSYEKNISIIEKTKSWFKKGKIEEYDVIKNFNISRNDTPEEFQHIQIDDIYNTLSFEFYHNIKNIKWLIYDIKMNSEFYPLIIVFDLLIDDTIQNIINKKEYDDIDNKGVLKNNLHILSDSILNKKSFQTDKILISYEEIEKIIKAFTIGLDNSFKNYKLTQDSYIELNTQRDQKNIDLEEFEEEDLYELNVKNIIRSLESVDEKNLYEFLSLQMEILGTTYYKYIIQNTFNEKLFNKYTKNKKYSEKNIYNFAKSLVHESDNNKYIEYPKYWESLDDNLKKKVYDKLNYNNTDDTNWFNLRRYYEYIIKIEKKDIAKVNNKLAKDIKDDLIEIVYKSLISRGVLSKFIFNFDFKVINLNEYDVKKNITVMNKNIDEIFENTNSNLYYYLNGERYQNMKYIIEEEDDERKGEYVTYLEDIKYAARKNPWYGQYALDFISQLNFFHKYYNCRVIYVTGGTGVGKSTQVPKLLLYGLKLNYINNGKVICTIPTRKPVETSYARVALELGVPKEYSVQYRHQAGHHEKSSNNLILKFVTDGYFYAIMNLPFLKNINSNTNQFDIVIVDEAHQHNKNMDLILSMKHPFYYNNSLKLVIISATMKDDEPYYRRFYRDINDNLKYPLNNFIKVNGVDRVNIDKRIHISRPGETTKFKIEIIYKDGVDGDNLILDIVKKTKGDIIYYQPGKKEINKSVEYLNNNLPKNVIALPYYAEIKEQNKKYGEVLENIDRDKSKIRLDRTDDFLFADPTIGDNYYDRAVLVATNIIEASVTIRTATVVVDTGIQKNSNYDYRKRTLTISPDIISDASAIQRQGRVGRVASGTVYKLYKKGITELKKPEYKICFENISDVLYENLRENLSEPLIDINNDITLKSNASNIGKIMTQSKEQLSEMFFQQYFIIDKFYGYYGNDEQYDYNNNKSLVPYYETGYDSGTLEDKKGVFYIIHPEERSIKRNLQGTITGLIDRFDDIIFDKDKKEITSKKIESFWEILLNSLQIIRVNNEYIKSSIFSEFDDLALDVVSTESKLDVTYYRTLTYGIAFDCAEYIIRIISFIPLLPFLIMIKKNKNSKYDIGFDLFKNQFENFDSEILAYLDLFNQYHDFLKYKNINLDDENLIYKLNKIYEEARTWASTRIVNIDTLNKYILSYRRLKYKVTQILNKKKNIIEDLKYKLNKISPNTINKDLNYRISICLLLTFPYNIVRNINLTPYYLSVYDPSLDFIYKISRRIIIQQQYVTSYILYLNLNTDSSEMSLVHRVNPEMLSALSHIYILNNLELKYRKYMMSNIKINEEYDLKYDVLSYYTKLLNSMLHDLKINYNNNVWNAIAEISNNKYLKGYAFEQRDKKLKYLNQIGGDCIVVDSDLIDFIKMTLKKKKYKLV